MFLGNRAWGLRHDWETMTDFRRRIDFLGGGVGTSPQVCSRREGDKERRPRVPHQVREANEDGDGRHSSSSHDVPEILRASIHAEDS